MAAGDVLLAVRDVWQRLAQNQVLEGVSFEVKDRVRPDVVTGQIAALLGPSGVGKTRLLRIIAGLDEPDRGQVTGHQGRAFELGSVGVVFQNYPLLRHRSVLSNLEVAGFSSGMSAAKVKTRTRELLERFGLSDRADYFPAQLSGGQRQRVAIAQQLMCQKALLLLDEPFSGLDPAALEDVMSLLVEVANMDELTTLLIVTHDIRSALMVSDTLLMLGRSRDQAGKVTSGARVLKEYDLVERGLAWRKGIDAEPEFVSAEREVKSLFREL